jgi:glucose-1-phosphate cytidylyltransferase
MKVVILAGGYGTRISEETTTIPKPLVSIGGRPILWHIMKIYAAHGLDDFVICCGYKGDLIKRYFMELYYSSSDFTIDLSRNKIEVLRPGSETWRVTLADTGQGSMTGGRLKRVADYVGGETFCMTYGDGVSDIDIAALVDFHRQEGALATVTAVNQPGRFGALDISPGDVRVTGFREKSATDGHLISGGFFVCEPKVLDYIEGDATVWEQDPLARLVSENQLAVYQHRGFWQNMDTLRDKHILEEMWAKPNPPWRIWDTPRRQVAVAAGT